jgi:hypothetical protein
MAIENKVQTIGFRASKSERRLIETHAAKLKMRLSSYIRLCVLSDIASRKPAGKPAGKPGGSHE